MMDLPTKDAVQVSRPAVFRPKVARARLSGKAAKFLFVIRLRFASVISPPEFDMRVAGANMGKRRK